MACNKAEQLHCATGFSSTRGKLDGPEDLILAEANREPVEARKGRAQHQMRGEMNPVTTGASSRAGVGS